MLASKLRDFFKFRSLELAPRLLTSYITKKKTSKYITRKKPEGKLLPESGSKYITKKKKTGPYITKKKKYITKKLLNKLGREKWLEVLEVIKWVVR